MIRFVNAKINLGLYVTGKREDGYHNLSTIFYPVGIYNGTPENPEPFCDILEVLESGESSLILQTTEEKPTIYSDIFDIYFLGRDIKCSPERNLVTRAADSFVKKALEKGLCFEQNNKWKIIMEKHLPDGAGLGGGSADCGILLDMLNCKYDNIFSKEELKQMAAAIGADCPFFIVNTPSYAEGIGDILSPVNISLNGKWCLIVKPEIYVSTADAFRGITVRKPEIPIIEAVKSPIAEWRGKLFNTFEDTVFAKHPILSDIKERLYEIGAEYASMSGSGSSLFGIFPSREATEKAAEIFPNGYIVKL